MQRDHIVAFQIDPDICKKINSNIQKSTEETIDLLGACSSQNWNMAANSFGL